MIDVAELLDEMPMPGRRPRVRRSPELEAAIIEAARQGLPHPCDRWCARRARNYYPRVGAKGRSIWPVVAQRR